VLVDPEILRAFSGQVHAASAAITAADLGTTASSAGDGLPGSTTQWAARSVGDHLTSMTTQLAENVAKMGQAVRGAADTFEVADDALAGSFDGLF
jgi:uncharacterized protein YukE